MNGSSPMLLAAGFLPPPTDIQVNSMLAYAPLVGTAALFVVSVVFGIFHTRNTRNPMYGLVMLGALCFPLMVEPLGDIMGATWYPLDSPVIVGDFFGRPMPLFVFLFYLAGIPVITCTMYALMKSGASAKYLIGLWAAVSIPEVVGEMIAAQAHFIHYYGNNAMAFGVPPSSIVQNGGFFIVIGWAMIALRPVDHPARPWRWAIVPFIAPASLMLYAVASTAGSYLMIHTQTGGPALWAATATSVLLNLLIPLGLIYSPLLENIRRRRTPTSNELLKATLLALPAERDHTADNTANNSETRQQIYS